MLLLLKIAIPSGFSTMQELSILSWELLGKNFTNISKFLAKHVFLSMVFVVLFWLIL